MAIGVVIAYGKTIPVQRYQKANIRIVISDKTLWQYVFG